MRPNSIASNSLPLNHAPRTATVLTVIALVLLPVAAGVGLFVPGFYRDAAWMIPQARGQDLVTLVIAEPLLLGSLIAARHRSLAAMLIWIGTLGYVLYTYAMYSYTAYFNPLFLVYVALFSVALFALFALIDLLAHLDVVWIRAHVRPVLPRRTMAAFLALVGVVFLFAWLGQIIPATLHGTVPNAVTLAKTPTSAVYVQDLAVMIPLLLLAAVWLWRRRVWGYALGLSLLVTIDVMLAALLSMAAFMALAQIPNALAMVVPFTVLLLTSLGFTVLFITRFRPLANSRTAVSPLDGQVANATPVSVPSEREGLNGRARDAVGVPDRYPVLGKLPGHLPGDTNGTN